jgi:hypothetical protein
VQFRFEGCDTSRPECERRKRLAEPFADLLGMPLRSSTGISSPGPSSGRSVCQAHWCRSASSLAPLTGRQSAVYAALLILLDGTCARLCSLRSDQ